MTQLKVVANQRKNIHDLAQVPDYKQKVQCNTRIPASFDYAIKAMVLSTPLSKQDIIELAIMNYLNDNGFLGKKIKVG